MTLNYELKMDDLVAFNQQFMRSSPMIRHRHRLIWSFLIIAGILCLSLALAKRSWPGVAAVLAAGLYYLAWYRWRYPKKVARAVRKLMSEGQNRIVLTTHTLEVAPQGLADLTPEGEARVRWSAVERVEEGPEHVFLYVGANLAHIIPKRAFPNGGAIVDFIAVVNQYRRGGA